MVHTKEAQKSARTVLSACRTSCSKFSAVNSIAVYIFLSSDITQNQNASILINYVQL